MNSISFIFCLFISISLISATRPQIVAFRMDDVQDYYYTQPMIDAFNVFKSMNLPVTGGIIGADFGEDSVIVDYMIEAATTSGWDFEICNHGWTHEYFSTYTLAEQINRFQLALNATYAVLGKGVANITSFIPPYNDFNNDTLLAIHTVGMNLISGENDMDSYAFPGPDHWGNYHWPIGAALTTLDDTTEITATETFSMIQTQLSANGFAAVMMHPDDFGNEDETTNQTRIQNLKDLIAMCQNAGYVLTNLRGMNALWFGTGSTSSSSSSTSSSSSSTGVASSSSSSSTGVASSSSSSSTGVASTTHSAPSVTSGMTPVTSGMAPITSGMAPVTSGMKPITSGMAPITSGVKSITSGVKSITSGVKSITSGVKSITSGMKPITSSQQPLTTFAGVINHESVSSGVSNIVSYFFLANVFMCIIALL